LGRFASSSSIDDTLDFTPSLNGLMTPSVQSGFIGDDDTLDFTPSLNGLMTPSVHEFQQLRFVGFQLLQRLLLDARNNPSDKPAL
jgi:hypothetical protein